MQQIARRVLRDVQKNFRYREDVEEFWESHASSVLADEKFNDDCDGFALTCAELMIFKGVPKSLVSIVYCETVGGGHLVCGLQTPETTWILDNNRPFMYNWHDSDYKWKLFMTFDKPGEWYSVSNSDKEKNAS